MQIFTNARVILADMIRENAEVWVENGRIYKVTGSGNWKSAFYPDQIDEFIDCEGNYLSPGFIDLHCHGGGGADFMDGTSDAIKIAAHAHLMHGTTGICPTTISCSDSQLQAFFSSYRDVTQSTSSCCQNESMSLPHFMGIHMEGPYFTEQFAGAQAKKHLMPPTPEHYHRILDTMAKDIIIWSSAPELPGAYEFGDELSRLGIRASMGHSAATLDEVKHAITHGFTHLTHFYNAMSTIRKEKGLKVPGLIEAGYLFPGLDAEIIADGIHVPKPLLQMILNCKDHDHLCLITDSMRGAGLPEGPSWLGTKDEGTSVVMKDGACWLPDFSCLAASTATTDRLVRTMVKLTNLSICEAVRLASLNPARFIGKDHEYGSITVGKHADLLIFDDNIEIRHVYVDGVKA